MAIGWIIGTASLLGVLVTPLIVIETDLTPPMTQVGVLATDEPVSRQFEGIVVSCRTDAGEIFETVNGIASVAGARHFSYASRPAPNMSQHGAKPSSRP